LLRRDAPRNDEKTDPRAGSAGLLRRDAPRNDEKLIPVQGKRPPDRKIVNPKKTTQTK